MSELVETSEDTPRVEAGERGVVVYALGAPLLSSLFKALLETRWPKERIESADGRSLQMNPDELLIRNQENGRRLRVFLSPPSGQLVADYLSGGDCSLLTITASRSELDAALDSLEHGPVFVSNAVVRALAIGIPTDNQTSLLTPREREVLRLVVQGHSNREMAERLVVSPNTIRTHLHAIYARLGVNSRYKLAARARELGLA